MSAARRLAVVRHAPTDVAGRCVGRTDVEATMPHAEAAARAAERLAAAPDLGLVRVWASPLRRCAGLAAALGERLGVPLTLDPRLAEIDHGTFEGRAYADLERDEPAALAAWMSAWEHEGPPGGESARALGARVGAWLDELPPGGHLLVAHAGVARALRVRPGGASWADAMARTVPHLCLDAVYGW
ncbi:MAG TPA: histidine phosphatase family protein [Polyangiaceae bacterium]|nr:histidine phosphatase family protein [Polyangiaceae bacterium]